MPNRETGDYRDGQSIPDVWQEQSSSLLSTVITGGAVALIKPDLLVGMAVGVGATLAPKLLPAFGAVLRLMIKGAVRAGYVSAVAARQALAEAGEGVQDMVAAARADTETSKKPATRKRRPVRKSRKSTGAPT